MSRQKRGKQLLTPIQAKLFEIAKERGAPITASELNDAPWGSRRPSSWTQYVPEAIYQVWDELPLDGRLVAYIHAAETRSGPNRYDL